MAKTQDYGKIIQDMMATFPVDARSMQDAFRTSALLSERMSKVVLDAAEKSAEISTKWTRETLAQMGEVARFRDEPTDYTKAVTQFASASAETAAENIASFAEVAKRVQMETVELVLAAGKDLSDDAAATARTAADGASANARTAADEAVASARKLTVPAAAK